MEGRIEIIYRKKRGRGQHRLHKLITSECEVIIGEEGREGWEDIERQLVETKEERCAREAREEDSDSDSENNQQNNYLGAQHAMSNFPPEHRFRSETVASASPTKHVDRGLAAESDDEDEGDELRPSAKRAAYQ